MSENGDCACDECKALCHQTPGWFLPGEAEHAAALLGMGIEDFFHRYLVVDFWIGDGDPKVLAPAKRFDPELAAGQRNIVGEAVPFAHPFYPGTCVFLDDDERCRIHAAKPCECRMAFGCKRSEDGYKIHRRIAHAWNLPDYQMQIETLLSGGRDDDE